MTVAILMERPGRDGWSHLISDRSGEAGRTDLVLFLRKIGVRRPLHRACTYAEHCDVRGAEIRRAAQAGARVISRRELGRLLKAKRTREEAPFHRAVLVPEP